MPRAMMSCMADRTADASRNPRDAFLGQRSAALRACATGDALPREPHPDIAGLVVDVPAAGGVMTVVALADGTARAFGTMRPWDLGCGTCDRAAAFTATLLRLLQDHHGQIHGTPDDDLPPDAHVRFHLLGPRPRSVDLSEAAFWDPAGHPLCDVIQAAQDVLVWIRTA